MHGFDLFCAKSDVHVLSYVSRSIHVYQNSDLVCANPDIVHSNFDAACIA